MRGLIREMKIAQRKSVGSGNGRIPTAAVPLTKDVFFVIRRLLRLVAGLLMLTLELETERRMRLQNQYLLAVTRNLFSHLGRV